MAIVQRVLPHYRRAFFGKLNRGLQEIGVGFRLVFGQELPGSVPRTVPLEEPWAIQVVNRYWRVMGREVVWQPCLRHVRGADLVVVEQANRLLVNHILQLRRCLGGPRLAFWGHGANLQARDRRSLSERAKAKLMTSVDWWFAYTDLSARLVECSGFPAERITTVQNAIDAGELRDALGSISKSEVARAKAALGIRSETVALYCGGMYPDKALDFLVEACKATRRRVPDFEMVFVGSGPDQRKVERACAENPWMHFVGPAFGRERAVYFSMSRMLLMPGAVGLAVIDSFVAALPMFTTDMPFHGPEIAYLRHGENGWVTGCGVDEYAEAIARFFADPELEARLKAGCRRSGDVYTLDNMVARFAQGIAQCLAEEPLR